MADVPEEDVAHVASTIERGSIIAAAGCGKTEQIVKATGLSEGRRLILTHTHAGVDVLRQRLEENKVSRSKYRVETIAGWSLRYSASFPMRSGIVCLVPRNDEEWRSTYEAAARLVRTGAVTDILQASYCGLFVDEYQDCSGQQHDVVKAIAEIIPTCVFGDPLQAIFDFKGQVPVGWDTEVFPVFPKLSELQKPHRWLREGNNDLATWLATVRPTLEAGQTIDLTTRPPCVDWQALPADPAFHRAKVVGCCMTLLGKAAGDGIIVIADAKKTGARSSLAKMLGKVGFSNIEAIDCKTLSAAAGALDKKTGITRLETVVGFIADCMTGAEGTLFLQSVRSHLDGGKAGAAKFGNLITIALSVIDGADQNSLLLLLLGFHERPNTHLFRREMFFAMTSAVRIAIAAPHKPLSEAIWDVQNKIRHAGRRIPKRGIGSTLLVKGLQFDRAVVVASDDMGPKDWYVALTRASKSVTIISASPQITPLVKAGIVAEAAQ